MGVCAVTLGLSSDCIEIQEFDPGRQASNHTSSAYMTSSKTVSLEFFPLYMG